MADGDHVDLDSLEPGERTSWLENLICSALTSTAGRITAQGEELELPFTERTLQSLFVRELNEVAARSDLRARENFALQIESWPGVGPVDVVMLQRDNTRWVFIELKWGAGTLYNCIWDVAKMATCIVSGQCNVAYLIAGAPVGDWQDADGAELFGSGTTALVELYERYSQHWRKWAREVKTHPAFLPQLTCRTAIASAPLRVRATEWELRVVRISRATSTSSWWAVGPVEASLGVADRQPVLGGPGTIDVEDPHPTSASITSAEDWRGFEAGDPDALWRLVRNPPRWWRFMWFPGDMEVIGKTNEELYGAERARLMQSALNVRDVEELAASRTAIDSFVIAHPGDSTAISAARHWLYAERRLS